MRVSIVKTASGVITSSDEGVLWIDLLPNGLIEVRRNSRGTPVSLLIRDWYSAQVEVEPPVPEPPKKGNQRR